MTDHANTSDHPHTARVFDSDLHELAGKVAEMGSLTERQIIDAVRSLIERDTELAEQVIANDSAVDALQHEIEHRAIETLARRQPVAVDLRDIVAAMRLCNDLERIGDHAKHIAKRELALGTDIQPQSLAHGVAHMAELVLSMHRRVLNAYANNDVQAALEVWTDDEEIDGVCKSLFRELLTYMMEDPRNITFCMHLMFCAKDLERIGDRATNIAETVYFVIEGHEIDAQRPKGDPTNLPALGPKRRKRITRVGGQERGTAER